MQVFCRQRVFRAGNDQFTDHVDFVANHHAPGLGSVKMVVRQDNKSDDFLNPGFSFMLAGAVVDGQGRARDNSGRDAVSTVPDGLNSAIKQSYHRL